MIKQHRAVIDSPETQRGPALFRCISLTPSRAHPGQSADFEQGTIALRYIWTSETPDMTYRIARGFPIGPVTIPTGPGGMFHVAGGRPVTVSTTTMSARAYPAPVSLTHRIL